MITENNEVIVKQPGEIAEIEGYSGAFCACGHVLHIKTPKIKAWYPIKCPVCGFVVKLFCGEEMDKEIINNKTRENNSVINLTVGELKAILNQIDDDEMDVIIPVVDEEDINRISGFRHVRTVGVLSNKYEPDPALCLSASSDGMDISGQLKHSNHSITVCERIMY